MSASACEKVQNCKLCARPLPMTGAERAKRCRERRKVRRKARSASDDNGASTSVARPAENGISQKDVRSDPNVGSERSDVAPSALSMILRGKDRVTGSVAGAGKKRLRPAEYPRLEERLLEWINQCVIRSVPVSCSTLKKQARTFARSLRLVGFAASDGWLANFKKRYDITFKKTCGEKASAGESLCCERIDGVKQLLNGYDPRDVFSTDEIGLFYKCLPDRVARYRDEKCRDGELGEDRITVLLACNMDGSQKLRPLVIGRSSRPGSFQGIKSLPTNYRSNEKSWMTTELFNEWLSRVNGVMKKEKRTILMFLKSRAVHYDPPPLDRVQLIYFPPDASSRLRPLDRGVIRRFKSLYRREVVSFALDAVENGDEARITLLTAVTMIDKAWRNVGRAALRDCFRECGFVTSTEEPKEPSESSELTNSIPSDSGWGLLSERGEFTFEEFVDVDDDVAVHGGPRDAEATARRDDVEEDDERERPPDTVTLSEARSAVRTLRYYALGTETRDDFFSALVTVENSLDDARWK